MNNLKRYTTYIINIVDISALIISFFLAFFIRFSLIVKIKSVEIERYYYILLLAIVAYFLVNIFSIYKKDDFLQSDIFKDFIDCLKTTALVFGVIVIVINFAKIGPVYSRLFEVVYLIAFFVIDFILRTIAKRTLISNYQSSNVGEKLIVFGSKEDVIKAYANINSGNDWRYRVVGLVFSDIDEKGNKYEDTKVVSNIDDIENDLEATRFDYDSVLLVSNSNVDNKKWLEWFQDNGKVVHISIGEYNLSDSFRKVDNVASDPVITYRLISPMSLRQRFIKRLLGIVLSLLLLPLFLVLTILVKLFTSLESPGKILIPRTRVGRNNICFQQYHFRVYRTDCDERIKQGKSPYTFIGRILRALHMDGAPMLINVLGGNMSYIGPKAPNLSKYLSMSAMEKNILSVNPGIIGYWSCSKDESATKRQEKEYIENWSIFKDISIFSIATLRFISNRALRIDGETHIAEEIKFCNDILEKRKPMEYAGEYQNKANIFYLIIKRLFDIVSSALAIIIFFIPMAIVALLVFLEDGGTPFYGHERIGQNGKRIKIWKFRSMRLDAGNLEDWLTPEQIEQYRKEFKITDDPRITKIGNFIRKTSIDELPQLFNILSGTLSVVGPRPIVEEETLQYGEDIAKFLSVKPGLTGYWQAYARNNVGYEDGKRQEMELYYVDNCSLALDIKILFKTVISVLKRDGAG